MKSMLRGTKKLQSHKSRLFWDRFASLCIDDSEDEINDIVAKVRNFAEKIFEKENSKLTKIKIVAHWVLEECDERLDEIEFLLGELKSEKFDDAYEAVLEFKNE